MRYLGSKAKIAKDIVPIIQSYIDNNDIEQYWEPFVGGANIIDKINCKVRVGTDIHPQLIALLRQAQTDISVFPDTISEEEYKEVKNNKDKYPDWYVGLVGFCSFGSKYWGGYRRSYDKEGRIKDEAKGVISNIKKQAPKLKDINFNCLDYSLCTPYNLHRRTLIYCDPPYRDTTKYFETKHFNYEKFYNWCRTMANAGHIVLISEYDMPEGFECIWEKETRCMVDRNGDNRTNRMEKLWRLNTINKERLNLDNNE